MLRKQCSGSPECTHTSHLFVVCCAPACVRVSNSKRATWSRYCIHLSTGLATKNDFCEAFLTYLRTTCSLAGGDRSGAGVSRARWLHYHCPPRQSFWGLGEYLSSYKFSVDVRVACFERLGTEFERRVIAYTVLVVTFH